MITIKLLFIILTLFIMKKLIRIILISALIFWNMSLIHASSLQYTTKQTFDNSSNLVISPDWNKTAYLKIENGLFSIYENWKKYDNNSFWTIDKIKYSPDNKHLVYFWLKNKTINTSQNDESWDILLDKDWVAITKPEKIETYDLIIDWQDIWEFISINDLVFNNNQDSFYFIWSKLEKNEVWSENEWFKKLYYSSKNWDWKWYSTLDDQRLNISKDSNYLSIYWLWSYYAFFNAENWNNFENYVSAFSGDDWFKKSKFLFPEDKYNNIYKVLFIDDITSKKNNKIWVVVDDNSISTRTVYKSTLDFDLYASENWGNKYKETSVICQDKYSSQLDAFILKNWDIVCTSDWDLWEKISINWVVLANNEYTHAFSDKWNYSLAIVTPVLKRFIQDITSNVKADYSKLETSLNINWEMIIIPWYVASMNFIDNWNLEVFSVVSENKIQQFEINSAPISIVQKQSLTADINSRLANLSTEKKQQIKAKVIVLLDKFNSRTVKTQTILKNIELLNLVLEALQ